MDPLETNIKEKLFQNWKSRGYPLLVFLMSFFSLPPLPEKLSFLSLLFSTVVSGAFCILFSLLYFLFRKKKEEEKKDWGNFFISLVSGTFLLLLSFCRYWHFSPEKTFLFPVIISVLLLFILSFDPWKEEEKTGEKKFRKEIFFALAAGFCGSCLFSLLPKSAGTGSFIRIFFAFLPLFLLFLKELFQRQEIWKKTGKCVLLFLLLSGGFAGHFLMMNETFCRKKILPEKGKQKENIGKVVLAASIAAGQFSHPANIRIFGEKKTGYTLQEREFPARVYLCGGSYRDQLLFDYLPHVSPESMKKMEMNGEKNGEILFLSLDTENLTFPLDACLTQRVLFSLRKQCPAENGLFVLLLPDLDADLTQKLINKSTYFLCKMYKNVLSIPYPKMLLASHRPLITDPAVLEKNLSLLSPEKSFFPAEFLQIFAPGLEKSRTHQKKENEEERGFFTFSFPAENLFQEDFSSVYAADLLYAWKVTAAVYQKYKWLFFLLFVPLYFIFRYFCSPGEKRKRYFLLFEHAFFLTAFPLAAVLSFPEKWSGKACPYFLLFLPAFFAFFTGIFRKNKEYPPGKKEKKSFSFLTYFFPLSPFFLYLVFALDENKISPFLSPYGVQPHILLLPLLFLFTGAGCGRSLAICVNHAEEKDLPGGLLAMLPGIIAGCALTFPLAYGTLLSMLPLLLFLALLRACIYWKN